MGTNKCLVRQLLCLYPFPHFSQRSSGRLLLRPPSFTKGWPSLALRTRLFWSPEPSSSPEPFKSSSMALSCILNIPSVVTNLRPGRLAGGDGKLPRAAVREKPFLDMVLRRELTPIGRGMGLSAPS